MWWRGAGLLALVFPVAGGLIGLIAGPLAVAIGAFLGSIPTWFVGVKLNRNPSHPKEFDNDHTLYSIPMQYWAFISGAFAIMMMVNVIRAGQYIQARAGPVTRAVPPAQWAKPPAPPSPAQIAMAPPGAWASTRPNAPSS